MVSKLQKKNEISNAEPQICANRRPGRIGTPPAASPPGRCARHNSRHKSPDVTRHASPALQPTAQTRFRIPQKAACMPAACIPLLLPSPVRFLSTGTHTGCARYPPPPACARRYPRRHLYKNKGNTGCSLWFCAACAEAHPPILSAMPHSCLPTDRTCTKGMRARTARPQSPLLPGCTGQEPTFRATLQPMPHKVSCLAWCQSVLLPPTTAQGIP